MFSKGTQQPTHGWLIGNRIIRKLAWAFIIIVLFMSFWVAMVTYTIRRDCNDPYHRRLKMFGYWFVIDAGSTKTGCPQ